MKYFRIAIFLFLAGCSSPTYLNWGYESGVYRFEREDYNRAAMFFNELAVQHSDYRAQYYLGLLWEFGLGSTNQDTYQAAEWYYKSASQGYSLAMYRLALVQTSINGLNEAPISWANLAARWGSSEASDFLKSHNLEVPRPDLYEMQQTRITREKAVEIERQNQRVKQISDFVFNLLTIGAIALAIDSNTSLTPMPTRRSATLASDFSKYVHSTSSSGSLRQLQMCPDGTYAVESCQMCPDGSYIGGGGRCILTPKGNYVRQVGNEIPLPTPDGSYVSGGNGFTLCPDGAYVPGRQCVMTPNGIFLGSD